MAILAILPVHNEELHLARCLESLIGWCETVIVVDSFSTDRTVEIARSYADRGVVLLQHAYEGPAEQKNWAIDQIPEHAPGFDGWLLFMDCDEIVSAEMRTELLAVAASPNPPAMGFLSPLRLIWYGKWIRWGGWYPNWKLRFVKYGRARWHKRRVHEHLEVDGPVARLRGDLIHDDLRDLTHSIAKHNRYSNSEAAEYLRCIEGEVDPFASLGGNILQKRRWIKTRIWPHLPGKALLYFIWTAVFRLGFLDGLHGLRFLAMHAMYKHFDALKLWELRHHKRGAPPGAIRADSTGRSTR